MKILQVTNAYPTERLPVYGIFIKEQIDALKDAGINCDLYFINGREKGKKEYLNAYFRLKRIVNNYDIIHAHHFLTALTVLCLKPKARVVVTFLSDGIREFIKPDNPLFNRLVKQNLYTYILKHSDARIFKKVVPEILKGDEFSYYLPNGVNLDIFYPIDKKFAKGMLKLNPEKTYILFASLIDVNRREKRYDIYRETISVLKLKYKRDDIEELIISNIKRKHVPLYFNAASIHLLTSDFEGSPNSVKESLACNTPVVSTDVGNVKEMLTGLSTSFVSTTNSPEKLAELVFKALESTTKEDSRKIITEKELDLKSNVLKLKDIYSSLLSK